MVKLFCGFGSFASVANPAGADGVPIEVKVPTVVFGQKLGVTTQAGMVSRVVSIRE